MSKETKDGRAVHYGEIDLSWHPSGDWIIIEMVERPAHPVFEIVPEAGEIAPKQEGVVVSVGTGRWNPLLGQFEPVYIRPGDKVMFDEQAGTEIMINNKRHKHMRIVEIDAVATDGNSFGWRSMGDFIFVEADPPEEQIGNIFLAPSAMEDKRTGTVLCVGDGRWNPFKGEYIPLPFGPGDKVLFGEYSGSLSNIDGKFYKHMKASEIVAYKHKEEL